MFIKKKLLFRHITRSSFSYAGNIWVQVINTTNIVAIQVIIGPLSMCTRLFQLISRFFRIDQLSKEDSILVCPGSFTKYVLFLPMLT